jgi:hypothetical protein
LQTILSNINQTPTDECDEHESQVPENDTTDCQDTYEVEKKNSFIYKAIREHVKIAVEHDF